MTIYESRIHGETLYGLEAVIEYTKDRYPSAPEEQSSLAREIIAKFGPYLAGSPERIFNTVGEHDMLSMMGLPYRG